ncbi:MAG: hypothetical protein WCD33_28670 [Mycobacterium sp.]
MSNVVGAMWAFPGPTGAISPGGGRVGFDAVRSAFDQNIFTEWHSRYGGRGVLIYWSVEKGSVGIGFR